MNPLLVVLASHRQLCRVCHGDGDVLYAPLDGRAARVRCPHCGPLQLPLVLPAGRPRDRHT